MYSIMNVTTLFPHNISTMLQLCSHITPNEDYGCISIGGLASRVKRKDTLALKLERQQEKEQSQEQDDTTWTNKEQWEALRNKIGTTLTRSACVFRVVSWGLCPFHTNTVCILFSQEVESETHSTRT